VGEIGRQPWLLLDAEGATRSESLRQKDRKTLVDSGERLLRQSTEGA